MHIKVQSDKKNKTMDEEVAVARGLLNASLLTDTSDINILSSNSMNIYS